MFKELDDELKKGRECAEALVAHIRRMGAGNCTIPVELPEGRIYEVVVRPTERWTCLRCEQLAAKARGEEVGEMFPEHFRTCRNRAKGMAVTFNKTDEAGDRIVPSEPVIPDEPEVCRTCMRCQASEEPTGIDDVTPTGNARTATIYRCYVAPCLNVGRDGVIVFPTRPACRYYRGRGDAPRPEESLSEKAAAMGAATSWLCSCGKRADPRSPEWRFNGRDWEHHHGYPIGHCAAAFSPVEAEPRPEDGSERERLMARIAELEPIVARMLDQTFAFVVANSPTEGKPGPEWAAKCVAREDAISDYRAAVKGENP